MSAGFTKLFSSITESTVWGESHATRIVWITMLAMADGSGHIWAAVPGLASRARVTLEECEHALQRFMEPDRYSRTNEHEGRRIEAVDGGWRLLNHAKYRAMRATENRREYMREYMAERRKQDRKFPLASVNNVSRSKPQLSEAEAEAEEYKKEKRHSQRSRGSRLPPDWSPSELLLAWAGKERPDLNLESTVAKFRDHWTAAPGSKGVKLDWDATFRNWVRSESSKGALKAFQPSTGERPSIKCSACGQKAFMWTDGKCDPCWKKSQGIAA